MATNDSRHDREARREEVRQFLVDCEYRRRSYSVPHFSEEDIAILHSLDISTETPPDEE